MAHASNAVDLPEVPDTIRDRYVQYHNDVDIEDNLRILEQLRPGLLATVVRVIDVLESDLGIEDVSVDFDDEATLRPVTIWAESTIPMEAREEHLVHIHNVAKYTLNGFADLVLVAVM